MIPHDLFIFILFRYLFLFSLGWPVLETNSRFTRSVNCHCDASPRDKEFVFAQGTPYMWKHQGLGVSTPQILEFDVALGHFDIAWPILWHKNGVLTKF